MPDPFHVDVTAEAGLVIASVHGELDAATAPRMVASVEAAVAGTRGVVVDLTGCGFIDSSGVRGLVQLGNTTNEHGLPFTIVCPPDSGSRFTLDLLGVGETHPVRDSLDAAVPARGSDGP